MYRTTVKLCGFVPAPVNTAGLRALPETQFDGTFADSFEQYVCSGKAGDIILFNPHALHKGTRNASVRRDVTAVYFQPGVVRNFQLPGLYPDVAASLSEYQRSVYRVGDETAVTIDVNTLPAATTAQREAMSAQAAAWSLPVGQIRAALDASPVDGNITVLGEENRRRLAEIAPQPKERKQLLGTIDDPRMMRQAEAYVRFGEDIQDMLHRAHSSIPLVRRTLLFAHLTCANLHGLYAATPGADPEVLERLAAQTDRTLRQYAGMVTLGHLTRQ